MINTQLKYELIKQIEAQVDDQHRIAFLQALQQFAGEKLNQMAARLNVQNAEPVVESDETAVVPQNS